jgi:hypothetical protein
MEITALKSFTYNSVTIIPGQTIKLPDTEAQAYVNAGKAIHHIQQIITLPETVRELQVADVATQLSLPRFATDSSGNVIGLVGPDGTPIYVNKVIDFGYWNPVGDGVTDNTAKWLDACAASVATGYPLLLPAGNFLISQTSVVDKIIGIPGKSTITLAPDFTKTGWLAQHCFYNSSFGLTYNDATASEVLYYGVNIVTSPNDHRSIFGLGNVKGGLIDRMSVTVNQVMASIGGSSVPVSSDALIDFYACVKNVTICRSVLQNLTGAYGNSISGYTPITSGGGGCIWIRNLCSDGSIDNNATEGIIVEDNLIRHWTSDEALSIYGVVGATRNNKVTRNRIFGLDSTSLPPNTAVYRAALMSIMPFDNTSGATNVYAAAYNNEISHNYIEDKSFLYNLLRIGRSGTDMNRLCYNNKSEHNTYVAWRSTGSSGPETVWTNCGSSGTKPDDGSKVVLCVNGNVQTGGQGTGGYVGNNSGNTSIDDTVIANGTAQTNAGFAGFQRVANPTTMSNLFTGLESCKVIGGNVEAYGRAYYNSSAVGGTASITGTVGYVFVVDSGFAQAYNMSDVVFNSAGGFVNITNSVPGQNGTKAGSQINITNNVGSMNSSTAYAIVNNAASTVVVKAHLNNIAGAMTGTVTGSGTTTHTLNSYNNGGAMTTD